MPPAGTVGSREDPGRNVIPNLQMCSALAMNSKDPKLVALQFNECINNQDLNGLALLMTDDHAFIDREGKVSQPK